MQRCSEDSLQEIINPAVMRAISERNLAQTIDTKEAERLGYIFCGVYGCTNVVPSDEEADRQGWDREAYFYKGKRRRCPGPHVYAWDMPKRPWWRFWE